MFAIIFSSCVDKQWRERSAHARANAVQSTNASGRSAFARRSPIGPKRNTSTCEGGATRPSAAVTSGWTRGPTWHACGVKCANEIASTLRRTRVSFAAVSATCSFSGARARTREPIFLPPNTRRFFSPPPEGFFLTDPKRTTAALSVLRRRERAEQERGEVEEGSGERVRKGGRHAGAQPGTRSGSSATTSRAERVTVAEVRKKK